MSKNSLVLVIQARMNSTRFPKKVISDLCGSPLIERILQRVKKVKKIKKIILATTMRKDDDVLVDIGKLNKVEVFRGSENDLVDRYYQAVKGKKFTHILRLPADNPIPDPNEYDTYLREAVSHQLAADICYAITNNSTLANNYMTRADERLREARFIDATENSLDTVEANEFTDARL